MHTQSLVPEPGRQALLKQLHEGHPSICHMKSLARLYIWWPGMDKQIEEFVKNCEKRQINQANPATIQPISWSWPRKTTVKTLFRLCGTR